MLGERCGVGDLQGVTVESMTEVMAGEPSGGEAGVAMLRLRDEVRFALFIAPLSMTIRMARESCAERR